MNHLSNDRLQDLLDDLGAAAADDPHVASCAECRHTLERLAELDRRLAALPRAARPVPALRRPAPRRTASVLLRVAAALLIFAVGYVAGQHGERRSGPVVHDPVLEVQRTGSEYAAAIARARQQGGARAYEVARSTLYGAATELARLEPERHDARRTADALGPAPANPIDF